MKYYVSLDKDGYVLSIAHTNTQMDFLELNLSEYDLTGLRKNAYKIGKDKLIFDQNRYDELVRAVQVKENAKKVIDLKQKLTESDYLVSRAFEEVMSLTNPVTWIVDVLKITAKYSAKYKETIANRKKWREEIEEIQNKSILYK